MTRDDTYTHAGTKKFTLGSFLKLTGLISFFLALGVATGLWEFAFLVIASFSLFLAEHFATSRRSEFFYLVGLPTIFWILCVLAFSIPFETVSAGDAWNSVGSFFAVLVLTTILSVIFSAVSVVMVCILCGIVYKLTGVHLLKFNWRD